MRAPPARRRPTVAPRAGARIETSWVPTAAPARSSLPARERGSKRVCSGPACVCRRSLPARERGSKHAGDRRGVEGCRVAPRAGARIETSLRRVVGGRDTVAPRAGARIETHVRVRRLVEHTSLPARERGSKRPSRLPAAPGLGSLPARERGSKREFLVSDNGCTGSLPARERGSKHIQRSGHLPHLRRSPRGSADRNLMVKSSPPIWLGRSPRGSADRNRCCSGWCRWPCVAPRAGARIETVADAKKAGLWGVAPRAGARIETRTRPIGLQPAPVAPRAGARIETRRPAAISPTRRSLPARERGSKPTIGQLRAKTVEVAPRAGARIETSPGRPRQTPQTSLPARERGSKQGSDYKTATRLVAPRAGARIETMLMSGMAAPLTSLPARERGSKRVAADRREAAAGRSPRGSADRNPGADGGVRSQAVAPRAGARIETP